MPTRQPREGSPDRHERDTRMTCMVRPDRVEVVMSRQLFFLVLAVAGAQLGACAEGGGSPTDAGKTDASFDAHVDLPESGAPEDASEDATVVQADAGEDANVELDAGPDDGGTDDGGTDAGVDANVDLCLDVDCSAMDGPCVLGVCEPTSGACTTTPRMDGTSCDVDGMDCVSSSCMAGTCQDAFVAECTACTTGVCSSTGTCGSEPTRRLLEGFESGAFAAGWTVGGSVGWMLTSGTRNSGTWSAQSGGIGSSQTSTLSTTVVAPVAAGLGFHSRTSTESSYDFLEVWVDGVRRERRSGETAWTERVVALTAGSHSVEWRYVKDGSGASGLDTVWIDDVQLRELPGTDGGFETSLAPWTSSGTAWSRVTSGVRTGSGAARAGSISHNGTTSMSTTFTLAATYEISFWYNVSSESGFDYFRVFLDGSEVNTYSGSSGWTRWARSVAAGSHTLELRYTKDSSVSSGSDTVWVDDVDLGWPAPSSGLCP